MSALKCGLRVLSEENTKWWMMLVLWEGLEVLGPLEWEAEEGFMEELAVASGAMVEAE